MNKIKNYISKNLISFIFKILISLLFAEATFLDNRLSFEPDIFALMEKIYFYPINVKSGAIAIVAFIAIFTFISLLELFQHRFTIRYVLNARTANKKDYLMLLLTFILLICAWLPYILSYFPGGIYPDTIQCFSQATNNVYNNQQPILYTLIIKLCIIICGETNAMSLFTILQIVFIAGCLSFIIFRLNLHSINKCILIILFIYFAFFTLVPLYVVSLWKDSVFSVALLMYIFLLTERIILPKSKPSSLDVSAVLVFMVLSIFLRNNGLYVIIVTTIIIGIILFKSSFVTYKSFIASNAIVLILCFIIQGPLFNLLKINGPFVENLGVLQQQMSYTMINNGDINYDDYAFMCSIMPFDDIGNRDYYRPFNVDSTKWSPLYDSDFLEEHKTEFIKIWFKTLLKNPRLFANSYLYSTLGYWDPFKQLPVSYTNHEAWDENKDDMRFKQNDYIYSITGASIRDSLQPNSYISSAAFLFITLAIFVLSLNKKDKSWLAFIPALITYLTVFIATPLAFALRYVYILVLTLPILIIYAFCKLDEK